jgi:two-component system, chemotaxis family, sensor kinase CheA
MVRFDELFQKHARGLRELARSQGKKVRVTVDEHEVAVDKQVLDKLDEALLHIARNAIDHGIESAAARSSAGKSARAEIKLLAREAGEYVEVIVEDDGRGVDIAGVQRAAVERGLLSEEQVLGLSKQDTLMLLFQPDFSTRDSVSDVSGRGIGLDIVRKQIAELDGSVRMESASGQGTRFVLRVPISTAFAKALVFKSDKQLYALPASAVERIVYAGADEIEAAGHGQALVQDRSRIPIMSLQHVLGLPTTNASGPMRVLLVLSGPPRVALEVDGLVGQRETLRRNLNAFCAESELVNGTAVIEGQKLVLFLNVAALSLRGLVAIDKPLPAPRPKAAGRERGRILFVDDSELTRDMVVSLLQRGGFSVREAVDGSDAWEAIQRDPPDLVLTDLDMPVMDGFALVQRIRSVAALRELPVIVLSTRGAEQDKRRAMEAGADAYLVKSSMRAEELNRMLEAYLQREARG